MKQLRVLLADDHSPFLHLSTALLEGRYDLVGTVRDGLELLASARSLKPDVIVSAVGIPYLGGIEACRRLSSMLPDSRVVLLADNDDPSCRDRAIEAGADGYVLKRCLPVELCRAIDEAVQGRVYVTPLLAAD